METFLRSIFFLLQKTNLLTIDVQNIFLKIIIISNIDYIIY